MKANTDTLQKQEEEKPSNTAATEKENSPCYISPTSSNKAQ